MCGSGDAERCAKRASLSTAGHPDQKGWQARLLQSHASTLSALLQVVGLVMMLDTEW